METIDENGVSRIVRTDAIGRPTAVCEISSNGSMPGGSGTPQSCGMFIAGTGFLTNYTYDWANAKTTITQGSQTRVFQNNAMGWPILVQEPESGQTQYSYAYNSTGLQVTRTRPKANQGSASVLTTTTTQYDKLGRVATITYNDGITPNKEYDYDAVNSSMQWNQTVTNIKGQLADTASGSGATLTRDLFSYDSMGRTVAIWQCAPSICGTSSQAARPLTFSYDLAGELTSEADLTSGAITYAYSPAGEVQSITGSYNDQYNPPNLVSSVTNGPNGPLNWQIGNGTTGVFGYDTLGRNNGKWLCKNSTSPSCAGGTKTYGNTATYRGVQTQTECDTVLNNCTNLGYDEFNRLASLTVTSGTVQNFTYVYDRWGNRWQQNLTAGSGPAPQLSFNTANNQMTNAGFQYDAAGNLINDGMHSYSYDAEGNVVSVDNGTTATYVYDALNRRVRVQTASATNEFIYDYAGRRISTWLPNGAGIEGRIYWGKQQIAFRAQNGETYFDQKDILGTERLRMNYAAVSAANYVSLPFGDDYTAHVSGTYGDQDNSHFAQLDRDAESYTDHAQFRQYGNAQGRWMSPDPYSGSYDSTNPQSMNRYVYAMNNPLKYTDPTGLKDDNGATTCDESGDCVTIFQDGSQIAIFNQPQTTVTVNGDTGDDGSIDGSITSYGGLISGIAIFTQAPNNSSKTFWQKNWDCVANVAFPVFKNELNPLTPGTGTAGDITSRMSQASMEGAASWSLERGLTVPLRSSIVRAGVGTAEVLGRASEILSLIDVIYAEGKAIYAEHTGCTF